MQEPAMVPGIREAVTGGLADVPGDPEATLNAIAAVITAVFETSEDPDDRACAFRGVLVGSGPVLSADGNGSFLPEICGEVAIDGTTTIWPR